MPVNLMVSVNLMDTSAFLVQGYPAAEMSVNLMSVNLMFVNLVSINFMSVNLMNPVS